MTLDDLPPGTLPAESVVPRVDRAQPSLHKVTRAEELRLQLADEIVRGTLAPGAPLIQFSYGMHAPVVPPANHSVICAARVWANIPPARVWVYRKI